MDIYFWIKILFMYRILAGSIDVLLFNDNDEEDSGDEGKTYGGTGVKETAPKV